MTMISKDRIRRITEELCRRESYLPVYHESLHHKSLPSVDTLSEVIELFRSVLFPGYFTQAEITLETLAFHTGSHLDRAVTLLYEQVRRGFCFHCEVGSDCSDCNEKAVAVTESFLASLPSIRKLLATDSYAAYIGDPAAKSTGEAIFCYPSVHVLTNYRIAHELYLLDVPLIPRIITELAHGQTGIDIHPGASIGEGLFIDHGTGTVVGETTVIGRDVRIYQGVTLGARSFPLDEKGNPVKGIKRHPNIEDNVIIYSGATILGDVTIGRGAVIGGNVWLTEDVAPGAHLLQKHYE
jgi:serine O-acetyltransferase